MTQLKKFYSNRYNRADSITQQVMQGLSKEKLTTSDVNTLRNQHYNPTISDLVRNINSVNRIVKHRNRWVQKIYPIYMKPEPKHFFDFRTQFFMPQKHFAGLYIDTLYFNIMVIWVMILVLFVTLYYDVLGKLILKNS